MMGNSEWQSGVAGRGSVGLAGRQARGDPGAQQTKEH